MADLYRRAKELFLEVCDLAPSQRNAVLARECAGDGALRAEVESLLEHHVEPETAPVSPRPLEAAGDQDDDRTSDRVGPYRLVRRIGHGGMGVVYLGYRDGDRFRRRVAIKVLKRGMDTEEILSRFDQERQVLGALNHPGIARLYDAGETADGVPYFAMEYIEGQPIDEYCDTHRLRIAERLELFRQVCAAVHYVHQNLMVHRDLKPRNIVVTGDGVPKLLDFGIAKLINPELSLIGGDPTAPDQRIMTPEYASPEQVRGTPIGVASDIYSLGVILYELLTGHPPYRIKTRLRAEIERIICEMDPEVPSTAASRVEVIEADEHESGVSTTITPENVAKLREGRPERLRRQLAGDLDNIVLMAMRKEPQRRYASAQQLAEDIRRHLEGLPVVARRDTAGYRLAKFVRRHRVGVGAAAAVLIALAGWAVTAGRKLEAEREHSARLSAMLDETLQLAHVFIFDFHDQVKKLDGSLAAREMLAATAQECLEDLRPHVGDEPRLLGELAAAYAKVGDIWGGHRSETFGRTATARANYQRAREIYGRLLARFPDDPEYRLGLANSYLRLGDIDGVNGDVQGALDAYEQGLDIAKRLAEENPGYRRQCAIALDNVGKALKSQGHIEQARHYYQQSLDMRERIRADNPDSARAIRGVGVGYIHLGEALDLLGDDEGALEMYRKSVSLRQGLVRRGTGDTQDRRYLALSHYFSARQLLDLDRPEEASEHVDAAVALFTQRAEDNPRSARGSQLDLAVSWEIRGRRQAALGNYEAALECYSRYRDLAAALSDLDPDNTFYRQVLTESHQRIGEARRQLQDLSGAVRAYREALSLVTPLAESDRDDVDLQLLRAAVLSAFGDVLGQSGELMEAWTRLNEAQAVQSGVLDAHPEHARAREELVLTLRRLSRLAGKRGDADEALAYGREAVRVAGRHDAAALGDLASALAVNGDTEGAIDAAQEALDRLADATGPRTQALRDRLREDLLGYRASPLTH